MLSQFLQFLSPPKQLSYEQSQRYKVLQYSLLVAVLVALLIGLINLGENAQNFARFLLACCGASLLGLFLNYRGKHRLSAILLSAEIFIAIIYTVIDGAGLSDPGIAAFPILIIFTGFILGRKGLLGSLGFSIFSIFSLYVLSKNRLLVLNNVPSLPRVMVLTILFVMTAVIVWIILETWEKSLAERHESEARYRTLAQASFEGIVISENGVIIDANEQFAAMSRSTRHEVIGSSLFDYIPSEAQSAMGEALSKGEERIAEYHLTKQDGSPFIVEAHGRGYVIHNKKLRITSIRDITERKLAEEAIRKSEEKFSKAFYSSTAALTIALISDGRFIDVNDTFLQLFGFSREEVIGHTAYELGIWDDPHDEEKLIKLSGDTYSLRNIEVRLRTKDRRLLVCSAAFQDLMIDGLRCVIATLVDITERKQSEEKLRLEVGRSNALARTAARLNTQLEINKVLESICQEIVGVMNVPAAAILLYNAQQDACVLATEYGLPIEFEEKFQPVPREKFVVNQVAYHPVVVANLQTYPNLLNAQLYADFNIATILWIGIYHKEQFLGIVDVYCFDKQRNFGEDEISLLKVLTDLGTQAIVNAKLYREVSEGQEHLRLVSQQLVEVQESERRSLALELHDELGQVLNGIKISLDMIHMIPGPAEREQLLDQARAATSSLIERVRQMSLDLRPSLLDEMGLLPTLKWFFRSYQEQTQAPVQFNWIGPERRLPPPVEITAYRIIQESLTNVIRHGREKQVGVSVWIDEHSLNLQIDDRGGGFDAQKVFNKGKSTGLSGMRERARLLGGELKIESVLGSGTRISANIPLVGI